MQGPSYLSLTRSLSWLLMPWLLTSPGHQQPWYWLCRIGRFLSYLRKDFNYLCPGLPTSTELPYSGTETGFPVREYGQRAKSTEIQKLPTLFQLSFCLYLTPTQIIYWSGHDSVAFLLITSGLKWLKHNPHYHKNNKPQDLIQLRCAPVRPITFDTMCWNRELNQTSDVIGQVPSLLRTALDFGQWKRV